MTTAISVKNLGKQYMIGAAQTKFRYNMLRDVIMDTLNAPVQLAKALVNVKDKVRYCSVCSYYRIRSMQNLL